MIYEFHQRYTQVRVYILYYAFNKLYTHARVYTFDEFYIEVALVKTELLQKKYKGIFASACLYLARLLADS